MNRLPLLVRKTLRDVRSQWRTFAATAFLAFVASMLFVGFESAGANLTRSCAHTYERLRFLDFYVPLASAPPSVVERIRAIPGVEAVQGCCVTSVRVPVPAGASRDAERLLTGRVIGVPYDRRPLVNDLYVESGRYLAAQRGEVLVEKRFALAHGYRVGDRMRVEFEDGRRWLLVVGLVSSPEFIWISPSRHDPRPVAKRVAVLFTSEADAHTLAGGMAAINELHVRVYDRAQRDAIMEEARRRLGPWASEPPVPREAQQSNAFIEHDRRALAAISLVFPLAFLLLGTIVHAAASRQMVARQRTEIGVLLSMGVSREQVAAGYLAVSALLSGGASVLGGLAGIPLGFACTRFYTQILGVPFIVINVDLLPMVVSAGLVTASSVGVTAWAIGRFVMAEPAALLRADFAEVIRVPHLEKALPVLRRMPLVVRASVHNVLRSPARSLLMVAGLSFAVLQLLMTLSFFDSQARTLDFFFDRVHGYDLYVNLRAPTSPGELLALERWPGVSGSEACLRQAVQLEAGGRKLDQALLGIPAGGSLLRLYNEQRSPIEIGDHLYAPAVVMRQLGARPGDEVRVRLEETEGRGADQGGHPVLRTTFGPLLYEPIAINPRLPLRRLQQLLAATHGASLASVNVLLMKVEPQALESVRRRLDHSILVDDVIDLAQAREDVSDLLRLVNAWFAMMLVFSGLLAFALLAGTTTMNVLERSRELAIMSVQGVRDSELAVLLGMETLFLWGVALAVGTPGGFWMGNWVVNHYASEVLQVSMHLAPSSVVATSAISLAICLLSTVLALRTVLGTTLQLASRTGTAVDTTPPGTSARGPSPADRGALPDRR